MSKQLGLFAEPASEDDWRETLRCPECKYRPSDEADDPNANLPCPVTEAPETYDEAMDFFEVSGAGEGCVFCPKCKCEFNLESGQPVTDGVGG